MSRVEQAAARPPGHACVICREHGAGGSSCRWEPDTGVAVHAAARLPHLLSCCACILDVNPREQGLQGVHGGKQREPLGVPAGAWGH